MGRWVHRLTNIDAAAGTGDCTCCGRVHLVRKGAKADGSQKWRCGTARRQDTRTAKYGLTRAEFEALLVEQGGACAICKQDGRQPLCIDHDHETGCVRGLLCVSCNAALEQVVKHLDACMAYLERDRQRLRRTEGAV